MRKKKGIGPNVVIELKRSSDDSHLERDAKASLRQIKDREYAYGLKGKTILYGIAFSDKEPFIVSEEIRIFSHAHIGLPPDGRIRVNYIRCHNIT